MSEEYSKDSNTDPQKHKAFFHLFTGNQSHIYSYILMLVRQINIADDVFQDVALAMWEHFDKYEIGTDFTAWGMRIARNKVIDYFRKNKANRIWYSDETLRLISDNRAKKNKNNDTRIKALEKCISKLSANDKHLIQLKYSQKITTKALSERIGRSVNGLYKSLSRIHSSLYQCIQRTIAIEE